MVDITVSDSTKAPDQLPVPPRASLRELQIFQREHDRRFYSDVEGWPPEKQVDHSIMHLTKVVGELARFSEQRDHGDTSHLRDIKERRLADGVSILLKLANLFEVDLEGALAARMQDIQQDKKNPQQR